MKILSLKNGFSLVEVLVVSAASLIIGVILTGILVNHNGVFYKQSSLVNEGLSLNDTLNQIDSKIRQATVIAAGYPEVSPNFNTGTEVLVLKLLSIDINGNIINDTYDYIVIARDSENNRILRMITYPDSLSSRNAGNVILTTLLESIEFKYLDKDNNQVSPISAGSIEVDLTVLSKTGSIGQPQSSSIITSLRNTL